MIKKWIESNEVLTTQKFNELKYEVKSVSPEFQLLFLKKTISEIYKKNISITIEDILDIKGFSFENYVHFDKPRKIDYTLDLIIHTLRFIYNKGQFPKNYNESSELVKSIADFIIEYLNNEIEHLTKIDLLFDECPERTALVRKKPEEYYINLRGKNYKVYDIYQGYSIVNKDKSGYGKLIKHYHKGIYAKGEKCYLEIIEKKTDRNSNDFIRYGKNIIYNDKSYPFEWKKNPNNYLLVPEESPVKSCEGRLAEKKCNLSSMKFWWCRGRQCMNANQNDHTNKDWRKYSLKDFLKILNLPFEDKYYYIFVGEINRLNRLLEKLKCAECNKMLRPSKQSYFGFYRVSNFHCTNENCAKHKEQIYLTHCLNKKCSNIIDSRVGKKCPNGLIICDKCGSCCSNEQFTRRIDNLKMNGQSIPHNLIDLVEGKKGHLEKLDCYCYECQEKLIEKNGFYSCDTCKISYDYNITYVKQIKSKDVPFTQQNNNNIDAAF